MPNYRDFFGHKNATILLSVSTLALPFLARDLRPLAVTAGCFLGLAMTPDWDLDCRKITLLGRIQFVDEYATLVPHRSAISHTPVLGTAIRFILTFGIPLLLAWLITGWFASWIVLGIFCGLCLSDSLHVLMDYTQTALKHRSKRIKYG